MSAARATSLGDKRSYARGRMQHLVGNKLRLTLPGFRNGVALLSVVQWSQCLSGTGIGPHFVDADEDRAL